MVPSFKLQAYSGRRKEELPQLANSFTQVGVWPVNPNVFEDHYFVMLTATLGLGTPRPPCMGILSVAPSEEEWNDLAEEELTTDESSLFQLQKWFDFRKQQLLQQLKEEKWRIGELRYSWLLPTSTSWQKHRQDQEKVNESSWSRFGKEAEKEELYTLINPVRSALTVMTKTGFVERVERSSLEVFSTWYVGSGYAQTSLGLKRALNVSSATRYAKSFFLRSFRNINPIIE
jgi:hypothetical protein